MTLLFSLFYVCFVFFCYLFYSNSTNQVYSNNTKCFLCYKRIVNCGYNEEEKSFASIPRDSPDFVELSLYLQFNY